MKKPFALSIVCLFSCLGMLHAQFILYNGVAMPGTPGNLVPFLQPYTIYYNVSVGGSGANTCTPDVPNIQQDANASLSNTAALIGLDAELNNGWPATGSAAFTDSLDNYINIVGYFKTVNSSSKIGFYAVPPQQDYANYGSVGSSFAPTAKAMAPLADVVDYYSPDFYYYNNTAPSTWAAWSQYVDTTLSVIQEYYDSTGAKPLYPYISSYLFDASANYAIDSATWSYELNFLYGKTAGAIIWTSSNSNVPWNPNAPWWRVTKQFLVTKGLAPAFVSDSFYVSSLTTSGVVVRWATAADTTTKYFVLQRSTDGVNFTSLSGQIARSGYAYSENGYGYTDPSPALTARTVYYRLQRTDINNNVTDTVVAYTKSLYRSAGGGVTVDLASAANWQTFNGTTWAAVTAPLSGILKPTDSVIVETADTWQNNTAAVTLPAGVTLADSGIVGTFSTNNAFTNAGTVVFCGAGGAQTIPGAAALAGSTWGHIVIDNGSGVTSTQSSASSFLNVGILSLTAGTFTVTASGGKSVSLYLDSSITVGSGNIHITNPGGTDYGVITNGKSPQRFPAGIFLEDTVYALSVGNGGAGNEVTSSGSIIVAGGLSVQNGATFTDSANLGVDALTIGILGDTIPVNVVGVATLGGTLIVSAFSKSPVVGQQFVIISAGSLNGRFSGVTLPAGYAGEVTNTGNNTVLTITGITGSYRSMGTGVTVDLASPGNWQIFNGSAWVNATVAPNGVNVTAGNSILIHSVDTWQNNTAKDTIATGVTLIDSTGNYGIFSSSYPLTNKGTVVFCGNSAQNVPGSTSLGSVYSRNNSWGNIVINNTSGVNTTQSGSNYPGANNITLQSGLFTVTASPGSETLYLTGVVTTGAGTMRTYQSGANTDYGIAMSGTSVQNLPAGIFPNDTVYALNAGNESNNVTSGGPVIVTHLLTVSNGVTFTDSSSLGVGSLTIANLGSTTPVTVMGAATLGGTLTISAFSTTPPVGQQFTILSAGSISGSFSGLVLPAGYIGTLAEADNKVVVTIAGTTTSGSYRSTGAGVTVDLASATGWQTYNGTAWAAATSAPNGHVNSGNSIVIRPADTWQNNTSSTTIPMGVALIDSGSAGTFATSGSITFTNKGTVVFAGSAAQTIAGSSSLVSSSWGNLVIDNPAGVTSTQTNASNFLQVKDLTLQSGTFTATAGNGKSIALYIDSSLNVNAGNMTVINAVTNYGLQINGTETTFPINIPAGALLNNTVSTLTIDNPYGVTSSGPLSITDGITLLSGTLTLGGSLTVGGNISYTALSSAVTPLSTTTGDVTLTGSPGVTITSFTGTPVSGQHFTLVSSTGGTINGTFNSSPVLPAGYTGTLSYPGSSVVLTITSVPPGSDGVKGALLHADAGVQETTTGTPKTTSGTPEIIAATGIKIYPNPADGQIYISGVASGSVFRVIDLKGQTVAQANSAVINVANLVTGIYFLQIKSGSGTQTFKFFKK